MVFISSSSAATDNQIDIDDAVKEDVDKKKAVEEVDDDDLFNGADDLFGDISYTNLPPPDDDDDEYLKEFAKVLDD